MNNYKSKFSAKEILQILHSFEEIEIADGEILVADLAELIAAEVVATPSSQFMAERDVIWIVCEISDMRPLSFLAK